MDRLIADEPERVLGPDVHRRFGARLPYLLKVLAVSEPLSLQVHPSAALARAGFEREEAAGIGVVAPERSFRDREHKPEMVLALTDFEALCGFRAPRHVLDLLRHVEGTVAAGLRSALRGAGTPAGVSAGTASVPSEAVRRALTVVLRDDLYRSTEAVAELVGQSRRLALEGGPWAAAHAVVATLADRHPCDPGVVAALLLEGVTLHPGDALFVPPGTLHAYLRGMAVEVMASSDNVLRAGLTSKHVDVEALLACTDWTLPDPIRPRVEALDGAVRRLAAPVPEFGLDHVRLPAHGGVTLPGQGPRIALCLDGSLELASSSGSLTLERGGSAFVRHDDGPLKITGEGEMVVAHVPT